MKKLLLILSLLLSLNLVLFIYLFNDKKVVCNKPHIGEWTPARDPETGADSSLIQQINFFVDQNIRLENYVRLLEEDNQRLGSYLAEKEFNDN